MTPNVCLEHAYFYVCMYLWYVVCSTCVCVCVSMYVAVCVTCVFVVMYVVRCVFVWYDGCVVNIYAN